MKWTWAAPTQMRLPLRCVISFINVMEPGASLDMRCSLWSSTRHCVSNNNEIHSASAMWPFLAFPATGEQWVLIHRDHLDGFLIHCGYDGAAIRNIRTEFGDGADSYHFDSVARLMVTPIVELIDTGALDGFLGRHVVLQADRDVLFLQSPLAGRSIEEPLPGQWHIHPSDGDRWLVRFADGRRAVGSARNVQSWLEAAGQIIPSDLLEALEI